MIKYKDIIDKKYDLNGLKEAFSRQLVNYELLQESKEKIIYSCLSKINFTKLDNSQSSIVKYSTKLLNVFYPISIRNEKNNPIEVFFSFILGFKKIPISCKIEIETKVKTDLRKMDRLLEHYNSIKCIQVYLKAPEKFSPRNHYDFMVFTFYKRAQTKYQTINSYLACGLDDRAIQKAQEKEETLKGFEAEYIKLKDYPYLDFIYSKNLDEREIDWEKIDFRKINLVRNKWDILPLRQEYSFENKSLRTEIISKTKPRNCFDIIIKRVNKLPLLNERRLIFRELKQLFNSKKYYGFYALALPQIEGIFSDIFTITEPKKQNRLALPQKVDNARAYYKWHDFSFDYFQYYLPLQRNKFSHSGNDSEIKFKAYQTLLDLKYLVEVFENVNAPLSLLSKMLHIDKVSINDISDLYSLYSLLSSVDKNGQLAEIERDFHKFCDQNIYNNQRISKMLTLIISDFDKCYNQVSDEMRSRLFMSSYNIDFELKSSARKNLHENKDVIKKLFKDKIFTFSIDNCLKLLRDMIYFSNLFLNYSKGKDKNISQIIDKFNKEKKNQIDNIKFIIKEIKPEITDSFLFINDEFQHVK